MRGVRRLLTHKFVRRLVLLIALMEFHSVVWLALLLIFVRWAAAVITAGYPERGSRLAGRREGGSDALDHRL